MGTSERQYLIAERQMWLRALDFIQHENIFLKNTIADIVKNKTDKYSLDEIEYFHNQFLNKDAVIALLRRDIAIQGRQADDELEEDGGTKMLMKHNLLCEDMAKMEKEFSQLKYTFNNYLFKNI